MPDDFAITLVQCPCWGVTTPPLATALLTGNLRNKGFTVNQFDLNTELFIHVSDEHKKLWNIGESSFWLSTESVELLFKEYKTVVDEQVSRIIRTGSALVGFTLYDSSVYFTLEFIRLLKKRSPKTLVVLGGPSAHEHFISPDSDVGHLIDALVVGEGDDTLPELCTQLQKHGHLEKLPGLAYIKGKRVVYDNTRKPVRSLDSLPFSDYSDYDLASYQDPNALNIFTSRGCVNRCHFCSEWLYFRPYRFRSGRNLFEEVQYHRNHHPNVTTFQFSDSIFNGSLEMVRDFCTLLVNHDVKISWSGQGIIHKGMTKELLQLMSKAGCRRIGYGLESGSEAVRKSMNKGNFSNEVAARVIRDTHDAGIVACVYLMFGYPTETEKDFQMTLDFIRANRRWIDVVDPSKTYTSIMPNTYLYDNAEEFGVKPDRNYVFGTFWETVDGKNTFPVRVKRYEQLCALCRELGYTDKEFLEERRDKWKMLGHYYLYKNDYKKACTCYEKDLKKHGYSADTAHFLEACRKHSKQGGNGIDIIFSYYSGQ